MHWFTSEDDFIKSGVVERLNRTIKSKMWKYFHHKKNHKWLEVLPKLMESYNDSKHSSIKMSPNEAINPEKTDEIRRNLYGLRSRLRIKSPKKVEARLKVGDKVKLSKHALVFDKKYTPNWTMEILEVSEVLPTRPTVYRVTDAMQEEIKGTFYRHELQLVTSLPKTYDIERILKTEGNKVFVKWKGYPAKFNSWILKSSIIE